MTHPIIAVFERCAPYESYGLRAQMVVKYGFSIPTPEAVEFIAGHCDGTLLEVGAGSGYWSRLLHDIGVDVVATDATSKATRQYEFEFGAHYPVVPRMPASRAIQCWPRAVLLSWPCYQRRWSVHALQAMRPGTKLFYIGEGCGMACASEAFFELLDADFDELASHEIPVWYGLHDYSVRLYRKKVSECE